MRRKGWSEKEEVEQGGRDGVRTKGWSKEEGME